MAFIFKPGKMVWQIFLANLLLVFTAIKNVNALDEFYYMRRCYPWFHSPDIKEAQSNCTGTLGCSLQKPYSSLSHQEFALCSRDGRTGILCNTDSDCRSFMETSYCKKAFCLCEERGIDRFYSRVDANSAITTYQFCAASADIRSIHIPLVLFPWRTLMIIFGTLVMTGLLLMTLKWISPIITTIRDYHGSEISQQQRLRSGQLTEAFHLRHSQERTHLAVPDKPPSYEMAIQLTDVLPTYEEVQKCGASSNEFNNLPQTVGDRNPSQVIDSAQYPTGINAALNSPNSNSTSLTPELHVAVTVPTTLSSS